MTAFSANAPILSGRGRELLSDHTGFDRHWRCGRGLIVASYSDRAGGRIVTQLTMVGRVNPEFDNAGTIAPDAGTDDRRWVDRGDCPNSIKLCVLANFHSYADDL